MRRKKIEITDDVKEMVETVTNFFPNDFTKIKNAINEAEKISKDLSKMKHTDYIKCRKELLDAMKSIKELRKNILETHKLFTKEYD